MSYAHNKRRKTIAKFKRKYGSAWHNHFSEHVAQLQRDRQGPPTGTLEDVVLNAKL